MSYPQDKSFDEEFQDEGLSSEMRLLRKNNVENYPVAKIWKKKTWILPLLFHTAIIATYTLFFLFTLWNFKFDSKCRLPDSIECENFRPFENTDS